MLNKFPVFPIIISRPAPLHWLYGVRVFGLMACFWARDGVGEELY